MYVVKLASDATSTSSRPYSASIAAAAAWMVAALPRSMWMKRTSMPSALRAAGPFAQRRVARAQQHAVACLADLASDFKADAFVGAGDQRHARG